jgi:hypothetical protein
MFDRHNQFPLQKCVEIFLQRVVGDADTTGGPRFGINTLDSDMIMQLAEVI